jgi:hypothetical protein
MMDHKLPVPLPEPLQVRYDNYMASANSADKRARRMRDQDGREEWQRVAKGWRDLAAPLK